MTTSAPTPGDAQGSAKDPNAQAGPGTPDLAALQDLVRGKSGRTWGELDAATPEPGSLIEAVAAAARKLRLRAHLEHGAPRWCSAERKLELRGLVEREQPEAPDANGHLQVEAASSRRRGHDDPRPLGPADLGTQGAVVEPVEAGASPPPAGQRQQAGDRADGPPRACAEHDRQGGGEGDERRQADQIRERDPEAERGEQRVWRRTERGWIHGATRSLSWSSRAGPIPGTASSSSTDVKVPCFWR